MYGSVLRLVGECEETTSVWGRLRAQGVSDIFTSPTWAMAAWRNFPNLGEPCLVVAYTRAGELAGVLPLSDPGGGPTWAGSPLGDEHDVRIDPELDTLRVTRTLVETVRHTFGVASNLTLHDSRPYGVLASVGHGSRGCPAPLLRLRDSDKEFGGLACIPGWSRDRRRGLRSRQERLAAMGNLRNERISDPAELVEALPAFVQVRLDSWATRERLGELPSMDRHPRLGSFLAEVAAGLASEGRCYLVRLVFDGVPIAQALYLRADEADLLYMSTYAIEFARYSPSNLLLAAAAQRLVQEGIMVIDLGRGDERYKFAHGAEQRYLQDVVL